MNPILQHFGLTPEIIRKYVLSIAPHAGSESKYRGLESRTERRQKNLAQGLTMEGKPRKNKIHSTGYESQTLRRAERKKNGQNQHTGQPLQRRPNGYSNMARIISIE